MLELEEALQKVEAYKQTSNYYQKQANDAIMLLKEIKGMNDHPLWLRVQAYRNQFDTIQHPVYGLMVIPK